jgi:lipid-A-disaccharide synthase
VVAGEASGDLHAARLVEALRGLGPCEVRGVAGPALRAAGVRAVVPMEEVAVLGFAEVLGALPQLLRARARLLAEARAFRPDAACLVDFPGFNLRLGPLLKARGLRVFYYIAPQVWAWHPERARQMARWVDRLAVVFPFEEPLFRDAGVPVSFVGHPLLDGLEPEVGRREFLAELGHGEGPLLALLPGSRVQEVRRHLPTMLAAARHLRAVRADLGVVAACAPGLDPALLRGFLGPEDGSVRVVAGRTRAAQAHATAAAVASGTATLETALLGTPLAVVYRVSSLSYLVARRLVSLERVGLPNIVAGVDVAPELLQDGLTPGRLADALRAPLLDPGERARQAARLAVVRQRLGEPGASRRAAALLRRLAEGA